MKALRLQQKELDARLAELERENEVSSSRHSHREITQHNQSRTYRSGNSRERRSKRRSRSHDSSEGHTRSGQRQRMTSPEHEKDLPRSSPLKEQPDTIMQKLAELEHDLAAITPRK